MLEILGGIAVLIVLAASAAVAFAIGRWILRPVAQKAADVKGRPQLSIIDLLCLFFFIQAAMAFIRCNPQLIPLFFQRHMDIYAWFACGTMWLAGARTLSRAGVNHPLHRGVFLALVMPVALFSAVALPSIVFIIGIKMIEPYLFTFFGFAQLLLVEVGLIAAIYWSGRFTRRMVAAIPASQISEAIP